MQFFLLRRLWGLLCLTLCLNLLLASNTLYAKLLPSFSANFEVVLPHIVLTSHKTTTEHTSVYSEFPLQLDEIFEENFSNSFIEAFTANSAVNFSVGLGWIGENKLQRHAFYTDANFKFMQQLIPGYRYCQFCIFSPYALASFEEENSFFDNMQRAKMGKVVNEELLAGMQFNSSVNARYAYTFSPELLFLSGFHFDSLLPTEEAKIEPRLHSRKGERIAISSVLSFLPNRLVGGGTSGSEYKFNNGVELMFGFLYGFRIEDNGGFTVPSQGTFLHGYNDGQEVATSTIDENFSYSGGFHETELTSRFASIFSMGKWLMRNDINFTHDMKFYMAAPHFTTSGDVGEINGIENVKDVSASIGASWLNTSRLELSTSLMFGEADSKKPNHTLSFAYRLKVNYRNPSFFSSHTTLSQFAIREPSLEQNRIDVVYRESDDSLETVASFYKAAVETEIRNTFGIAYELDVGGEYIWNTMFSVALQNYNFTASTKDVSVKRGMEYFMAFRTGVKFVVEDLVNFEPFFLYLNQNMISGSTVQLRQSFGLGMNYSAEL